MDELVEKQKVEHRIELRQEDFQQLERWDVPQERLAETREAFRQGIVNIQTEIDATLRANMQRRHPEVPVRRAAPVAEPPVQQQAVQESRKERRERLKKRKAAAKACPVGDEDTFDMVRDLQQDMTNRMNSRNKDVVARCEQAHVDTRLMLTLCQGYRADKKGRPATPEDALKKQRDEQMIDDYLSGDQQRRKPYLDAFVKEMLTTPISMDMFAPERFQRDAAQLKLLGDKLVYFENLQNENPEYFAALPQVQKDMLRALEPVHLAFTGLLTSHFNMRGVNYNLGAYHSEMTPIEMGRAGMDVYTPQLTAALDQFRLDEAQVLRDEMDRQMAEAEQVLGQEYDAAKRAIEENSGPGQQYEKYAGIRFTNRAYFYQYEEIANYRAMLADHPEEYAANKAVVDQIYAELAKAIDIGADYYYRGKVISYAADGNPLPEAPGAPLLSGNLRGAFARRLEEHQAEETKIQHRITGLADLLQHYLRGKELSPMATATLAQVTNVHETIAEHSLAGSVVTGLTREQAAEHGFVSSHFIVPETYGKAVIKAGNGFLCAKDAGEGMKELRPTLPETVEIGGKSYPLRHDYNLMVKSIVSRILDADSGLRDDSLEYASGLADMLSPLALSSMRSEGEVKEHFRKVLADYIAPTAAHLMGGEAPTAFLDRMTDLMSKTAKFQDGFCMESTLFPERFLDDAFAGFVLRAEKVKTPLAQRQARIRQAMEAEGGSEDEIQSKLEAVANIYADTDAAMAELRRIRDMDPDSPDVPLPNTCVCTGSFYEGLGKAISPSEVPLQKLSHYYNSNLGGYFQSNPQSFVTHMKNKFDGIEGEEHPLHAQLAQVEAHLSGDAPALTPEDVQFLEQHTKADIKYDWHVAANVGLMADGHNLIVESYAPTADQFTVTPFSTQSTVGMYKNGAEGMKGYYLRDNPLCTRDFRAMREAIGEVMGDSLPGDPQYKPKTRQDTGGAPG